MNRKFHQSIAAALAITIATGIPTTHTLTQPSQAQEIGEASGKLLQQLNLSNDQLQQIKNIRSRNNSEIRSSRQRVRQLQQEIQELMSGTASSEQVRAKFNELQSVRQQAAKLQFEQTLAMREVLTPQQRAQLAQLIKQRRETRHNRR
ncbi:Spy/CpxP family protein refolding chaperone [Pseudanabaena sp. PCC 6802]|uniref:Spy/CpxP family protein refolding chaperone n=1 Tax=Pseudanabaena sp. PCC 6802 TaxID=118173 RepID=UPI00034C16FC|nr:Spy/CpxP family protein refolding chaperone [Pseudanabaena sp. PCC 6802]